MVEFEKGEETARDSGTRWQVIEDPNMKIQGSKEVYFNQVIQCLQHLH